LGNDILQIMFGYNLEIEHTPIIREIIKLTGCETYLELGVSDGRNIHEIVPYCKRCIGVDIADIRRYKDYEFHLMPTSEYFKKYQVNADIIFIDANHDFEYVKEDFENSLKILNKHGIILIHDTDPISREYLKPECCSDSYKIVDWIRAFHPELNILTLPVSVAGLTIINRSKDRRAYDFI